MKIRIIAAITAAAAALSLAAGTVPASASSVPVPHSRMTANADALVTFALYANGGSTAAWANPGTITLEASATAGASAQVDVTSAPSSGIPGVGQLVPNIAPTFTSSPASEGGDPRWVIELHNGSILFGYGSADGWSCSFPAVTGTYDQAVAACVTGLDDWVTAAFVVDDSGEPGISFSLTGVQYDGVDATEPAYPQPSGLHQTVYATSASLAWSDALGNAGTYHAGVWNRFTHAIMLSNTVRGGHDRASGLKPSTAYCWDVFVPADAAHQASPASSIACFKTGA